MHTKRTSCRSCGRRGLEPFLHLGEVALANAFLRSPAEFAAERRFPLEVALCEACALVQLVDEIDPEVLFREYVYVTGTSETMAAHFRGYAADVVRLLGLGPEDLVVEAASNDGSLLAAFQTHGVRTLGVEPARNVAALARARGVETLAEFFGPELARELRASRGPARAVIGNNVLAHVPEPVAFLRGFEALLAPGGLAIVEVPYLAELVDRLEYDTVYHEHLCYFSVSALLGLFEAAGLSIARVERQPVHGGSLRVHGRSAREAAEHAPAVLALAAAERARGLTALPLYQRFARDVAGSRERLLDLLGELRDEGRALAAYGAPAKGNTLLNYCGITTDLVPYTVDKSPLKVGLYTPGSHLPVLPVEALLERRPDDVLLLAWNLADEVQRQQRAYRERGGRFLLPLPEPRVL